MVEMLTAKEIAERENISVQAVYKRMRLNKIKPMKKLVEGRTMLVYSYNPPANIIEGFKQERESLNHELQNVRNELKNALEQIALKDKQILLIEDNSKRFKDELNETKAGLKSAEKRVIEVEIERGNLKDLAEKLAEKTKVQTAIIIGLSAVLLVGLTVMVMMFISQLGRF